MDIDNLHVPSYNAGWFAYEKAAIAERHATSRLSWFYGLLVGLFVGWLLAGLAGVVR